MLRSTILCYLAVLAAPNAVAQRGSPPARLTPATGIAPVPAPRQTPSDATPRGRALAAGIRPAVVLTGYWPPTNEMVRRFSRSPVQNPLGWIGSDWMGRGYDVYAFFPEFSNPNCGNCGMGMGDLEVDYQDTLDDFTRITDSLNPIAIITFSRGANGRSWEVEKNQFNRAVWVGDFLPPRQPTPAPPDGTLPAGALRLSALPAQRIVDAIAASPLPLLPFVCESVNGGGYLSEYIAYLGVWYQARHNDPLMPGWCVTAGHVHVGTNVSWPDGTAATEITLATVLDHVDEILACSPMQGYCDGGANSVGIGAQLSGLGAPSIAANSIRLLVQRVPNFTAGLTFYGPNRTLAPLGDGSLCVGGGLTRLPVESANVVGAMTIPLDFSIAPLGAGAAAVAAGSTWNFQTWYRDSGFGAGFNTTNALEITFCP